MFHRLHRINADTYSNGRYKYDHYVRHRESDDWHFIGPIYARSPQEAKAEIVSAGEKTLEWED